jgi:hypothetical protein
VKVARAWREVFFRGPPAALPKLRTRRRNNIYIMVSIIYTYMYIYRKVRVAGAWREVFFFGVNNRRPYQNSELGGETIYISNGLYHIYVYIKSLANVPLMIS